MNRDVHLPAPEPHIVICDCEECMNRGGGYVPPKPESLLERYRREKREQAARRVARTLNQKGAV